MGMEYRAVTVTIIFGLGLFWGCATPVAVITAPPKPAVIPAKMAVAPFQVANAILDLPSSGRKNIATKLPIPVGNRLALRLKDSQIFATVIPIKEDALPTSPSIPELAQAGRDTGADVVIQGKIIEFEGHVEYGFKTSLMEHMVAELSVYETATGNRLWFSREKVDVSKAVPVSIWSEEMIESQFISMAAKETLVAALATLAPKLHGDMASYRPPVVDKMVASTAEFLADVDRVPRTAVSEKKNAFAVVIGIENYRDLPHAEFTARDAKIMKEYLVRVMGFPEPNIITLLNERATKSDIEGYIGTWLKNNVEKDSDIFVYYAGHGAPNPVTGEAFIIPFDGNPAFPEATGIPLKRFYKMLTELQVKEVVVVMDSCFSGSGGRSVMAKGGRPMAVSVENPVLASNNVIVMTSAAGTEISSSYPEKRHGLFSYFLFKGLQGEADINGDKSVSIGELYNYLAPQVRKVARVQNLEQTPTLLPGFDLLGSRANISLGLVNN